ncbi:hypothetical protein EVAR_70644_1 [Eumeta japonica]|uniref:DUF5641 domain-containing protein n=1 Tax=Eumeta variegata TaxID=151549 RepID=A0A4C1SZJ6_EUMVA|nr:hypothetical protein EVAR_70644_1 [Eumeta japonica]
MDIQPDYTAQCPTNDESLRSALNEVEFIINSRPLIFASLETQDDEAITPNHLLIGSATGYKPICTENFNLKQQLSGKQTPLSPGNVFLIVDDNMSGNCWLGGIVTKAILARDGQVRQAVVRTKNGILRRPVSKLAILDVGDEDG